MEDKDSDDGVEDEQDLVAGKENVVAVVVENAVEVGVVVAAVDDVFYYWDY